MPRTESCRFCCPAVEVSCRQGPAPSRGSREFPPTFSCWWLLGTLGLWLLHPSLCCPRHMAILPVCPPFFLVRSLAIGLEPSLSPCDLVLTHSICRDPVST